MPIVEPPVPDLPLSQGDVLRGVTLSITRESWAAAGGEPKKTSHPLCLIISRPCVVGHKPNAVVAAVQKMTDNVPGDVVTFDDICDFLTELRDGADSPDVFYLGQVPGFDGRFGARLDSLHTIQIPGAAEQRAFTDQKRVGRLHGDFCRDLHTRIFRAFATLGFDDHSWMSDHDLSWAVARGRHELLEAQSTVERARASLLAAQAQGFRNDGEKRQLEKAVTDAQGKLEELTSRLKPYIEEQAKRQQAPPQT
jgi:hypothetical protein